MRWHCHVGATARAQRLRLVDVEFVQLVTAPAAALGAAAAALGLPLSEAQVAAAAAASGDKAYHNGQLRPPPSRISAAASDSRPFWDTQSAKSAAQLARALVATYREEVTEGLVAADGAASSELAPCRPLVEANVPRGCQSLRTCSSHW